MPRSDLCIMSSDKPFEKAVFRKAIATIDDLPLLEAMPRLYIDRNGAPSDTSRVKKDKEKKPPKFYSTKDDAEPGLAGTKYDRAKTLSALEKRHPQVAIVPAPVEEEEAVPTPVTEAVAAPEEISEADRAVIDALAATDRPRREKKRRFPEEVKPEVVEPKIEVRKILKIDFDVDRGVTSYIVLRVSNHKKTITAKTLVKSESGRAAIVAFHKKYRAWMTMPADVAALLEKRQ